MYTLHERETKENIYVQFELPEYNEIKRPFAPFPETENMTAQPSKRDWILTNIERLVLDLHIAAKLNGLMILSTAYANP